MITRIGTVKMYLLMGVVGRLLIYLTILNVPLKWPGGSLVPGDTIKY